MSSHGRRVIMAAVIMLLLALFAVPLAAYAEEPVDPCPTQAAPAADEAVSEEPTCSDPETGAEGAAPCDVPAEAEAQQDAVDPAVSTSPAETGVVAVAAPEAGADPSAAGGTKVSNLANPDTQAAVEAVLRSRKRQFDSTAAALQRNINSLAAITRRLDAAGVNTYVARVRLAEGRAALSRARVAERIAVARYRSVIGAEDESAAYMRARSAARTSSALLERARVKVLTATKTLRAIVKNVTV